MDKTPNRYWAPRICVVLTLTTLVVFWQVHKHEFVNYDDPKYITENEHVQAGLARDSIAWAFTTGHASNWHPLTWLSHMLDCQLFETDPVWHHLTSLLLHITNTLLLFGLLKRMTGALWRSAFVAAAFALHPLHVESVAWVAERKDVLSTVFWMLTMWAYVHYAKHPNPARYLLTVAFFALGLMAKPMLVTLPFVLLLLDYWPLGRFQLEKAVKNVNRRKQKPINTHSQWQLSYSPVWEKVPFFVLSAISSIVTFLVQQHGGAVERIESVSIIARFANASISYLRYIGKTIWPSRLAVFYPHPGDRLQMWQAVAAALLLLGISIWIIWLARSHKYLPVGWLWFLGTLVPVIGLVQVGAQALADRYTYVPLTGLFIIIAWGLSDLLAEWRYRKIVLGASAIIVLLALSICTRLQLRHWRNSITLFEHTIEMTNNNYLAHSNFGVALVEQGKLDEAVAHFTKALQIKPGYTTGRRNLGYTLVQQGKLDEAIAHFTEVLRIEPDFIDARLNLGCALAQQGKLDEAIANFTSLLQIKPNLADAHENLGKALLQQGKLKEAIGHYREALRIEPLNPTTHNELGSALGRQNKLDEAITHFTEALRIKSNFADAYCNLGCAMVRQGRLDEAIANFNEALRIKSDFADAHYNLGYALFLQGKFEEAIEEYQQTLQILPDDPGTHNGMGVILTQQGKLDEAIAHFKEALRIKPDFADAQENLNVALARRNELDEAGQPYIEP